MDTVKSLAKNPYAQPLASAIVFYVVNISRSAIKRCKSLPLSMDSLPAVGILFGTSVVLLTGLFVLFEAVNDHSVFGKLTDIHFLRKIALDKAVKLSLILILLSWDYTYKQVEKLIDEVYPIKFFSPQGCATQVGVGAHAIVFGIITKVVGHLL